MFHPPASRGQRREIKCFIHETLVVKGEKVFHPPASSGLSREKVFHPPASRSWRREMAYNPLASSGWRREIGSFIPHPLVD